MVGAPSVEETIEILYGLRERYEKHHKLVISDEALAAAAKFADQYIADRFLPDKAIDVIDEAGAAQHLQNSKRRKTIGVKEIEEVVAKIARIPQKPKTYIS